MDNGGEEEGLISPNEKSPFTQLLFSQRSRCTQASDLPLPSAATKMPEVVVSLTFSVRPLAIYKSDAFYRLIATSPHPLVSSGSQKA